jgi:hypothetical protein
MEDLVESLGIEPRTNACKALMIPFSPQPLLQRRKESNPHHWFWRPIRSLCSPVFDCQDFKKLVGGKERNRTSISGSSIRCIDQLCYFSSRGSRIRTYSAISDSFTDCSDSPASAYLFISIV